MATDSKTVKTALKEARDLIDGKDYKGALKCLKRALNVDKDNYTALVFCGLCLAELDQHDQAVKAYERAVAGHPDAITGWQGLAKLLEKLLSSQARSDAGNGDDSASRSDTLISAYHNLLRIYQTAGNVEKYVESSEKLVKVLVTRNLDEALTALQDRISFLKTTASDDLQRVAYYDLIRLLNHATQTSTDLTDAKNQLFCTSLEKVLRDGDESVQNMDNFRLYLRILYKLRRVEDLASAAIRMHKTFVQNALALEWLCKAFLEWSVEVLSSDEPNIRPDEGGLFSDLKMSSFVEKLKILSPSSTLAHIAGGVTLFLEDHFDKVKAKEAKREIETALGSKQAVTNFTAVLALSRINKVIGDNTGCEIAASQALNLLEDKVRDATLRRRLKRSLALQLVHSLYKQAKFPAAMEALQSLETAEAELGYEYTLAKAKIFSSLGKQGNVEEALTTSDAHVVRAILCRATGRPELAYDALTHPDVDNDDVEVVFLTGQLLLELGKVDNSLPLLLQSAKRDTENPLVFLSLGHAYRHRGDLDRARKCYLKSVSLDRRSAEAGKSLSDVFRAMGMIEDNFNFLSSLANEVGGGGKADLTWAQLRLGIHYLETEDFDSSIRCLQKVLRCDPDNTDAWESLADAYWSRGSLTAALKAYIKVLKVARASSKSLLLHTDDHPPGDDGALLYARMQVATIKHSLGQYNEAIDDLTDILRDEKGYVPALKVMAESLLARAKEELFGSCLTGCAQDSCENALAHLTTAVQQSGGDLVCLWKLMGDACLMCHGRSSSQGFEFKVPSQLMPTCARNDSTTAGKNGTVNKPTLLRIGTRCYVKALQIQPECSNLWHDLAFSFYAQMQCSRESPQGNDGSEAFEGEMAGRAITAIRRAIGLEPGNHTHWNALGVFSMALMDCSSDQDRAKDLAKTAQHAIIKSVSLENTADAWANLGVLYLKLGDNELANKAFLEAQSQDPSYINGWIGQATLAELTGCKEEASDLFRHTTSLGNHKESLMGYANWVCRILRSMVSPDDVVGGHERYCIEKMHGVTVATDCLTRYLRLRPGDACALNMLGLLLDRENLLGSARGALEAALSLLEANGPPEMAEEACVLQNLGRVLYKMGEYPAARDAYLRVDRAQRDFYGQVGLAVCLAKCGALQDAYEKYQQSLEFPVDDGLRSQVLTAMAFIAYKVQGGDSAKTLLFQACQFRPASINGLFALCVLGLKQSDPVLVGAALGEMAKFQDGHQQQLQKGQRAPFEKHLPDVEALKALVALCCGDADRSNLILLKAAHQCPHLHQVWHRLAYHLLVQSLSASGAGGKEKNERGDPARLARSAARFALKAGTLQHDLSDESTDASTVIGASVLENSQSGSNHLLPVFLEVACLLTGGGSAAKARVAASKAVHLYPYLQSSWCLLLATPWSRYGESKGVDDGYDDDLIKTRLTLRAKTMDQRHPKLDKWLSQLLRLSAT